MTIPRLELSAAVVATRLDRMVMKEIGIPVDQSIFWTDSTCVLGYIANDDKRFHTFVANLVAAIREVTSPPQWKHVSTKQNPADDASRGLSAEALLKNKRWIQGPDFLWKSEDAWPSQQYSVSTVAENDPEVKREPQAFWKSEDAWPSQQYSVSTVAENDPEVKREPQAFPTNTKAGSTLGQLFGRFSQWHRLKKFVAWILRYRANLRSAVVRRKSGPMLLNKAARIEPITVEEMNKAEREILIHVQKESFQEEIATLKIASFKVEREGVAKLKKAKVKKSSRIFKLDPQLADGLLRVRRRLQKAPFQLDAKHPIILPASHHVVSLIICFYHHTSEHSGTVHVLSMIRERFWILKARAAVKRTLHDCFRRRKRQAPVGEQKMTNLPQNRITPDKSPFPYVGVECFGPFLIRRGRSQAKRYGVFFTCLTVRAFVPFERLLKQQVLDDEGFATLICEVESIVNGRPLTKVSDDPRDLEALTPNCLLLLRSGATLPPGVVRKEDVYSPR